MKKEEETWKSVLLLLWQFGMTVQLCFVLVESSETKTPVRRDNPPPSSSSSVKLNVEKDNEVVIYNGLVRINLSRPQGHVTGISYNNIDNVLETRNEPDNRGYFDVDWNSGAGQRTHGTNFSVIEENENQVEVSFLRRWTSSIEGSVPITIDKRYIMRRGDSGFYSYVIFERSEGFPAVTVYQTRLVFKLRQDMFHYMAISDKRQRTMPTAQDRASGQPLAYPEAVLLTHAHNANIRGEVDDKYQYSCENQENRVHGWISSNSEVQTGFWVITPSNEFRNAGPLKQDLTSHVGPTTLSMFVSTHYAGKYVAMNFEEGETYKKVFGPIFVYLNSASHKSNQITPWLDAVQRYYEEVRNWPYDFPRSQDFIPPNQRGSVAGQLQVRDWTMKGWGILNAKFAYVGLALPGENGSWQKESKGYQFWTRADSNGYFTIKNVVPGDYNLYAWVPGFIGDYTYNATISIKPGGVIKLGSLVYSPPRNGPTIWEIGVPDRSAAEFYIPDPYPNLTNKLYLNLTKDKFRQYGLWQRYTDNYPDHDLVYNVGINKYDKDWFYAHVSRNVGNNKYQPTTWQIKFELNDVTLKGNYTFQLALASTTEANLEVRFNDESSVTPYLRTGRMGKDNAIARHGIHGLYTLFSCEVPSNLFIKGSNTIYLKQTNALNFYQGVMYDYLRLESPPSTSTPRN